MNKVYRINQPIVYLKLILSALAGLVLIGFRFHPIGLSGGVWLHAIEQSSAFMFGVGFCGYAIATGLEAKYFRLKIQQDTVDYHCWSLADYHKWPLIKNRSFMEKRITGSWNNVYQVFADKRGSVFSADGQHLVLLSSLPHYTNMVNDICSRCQPVFNAETLDPIELQHAQEVTEQEGTERAVQFLCLHPGITRSSALSIVLPLAFMKRRQQKPRKGYRVTLALAYLPILLAWIFLTFLLTKH